MSKRAGQIRQVVRKLVPETWQQDPLMQLNDIELRVLGVLIEKSLTQAMGYPMTLNSITLGANQKQNREPVVEYSEGDVSDALRTLQYKGLVHQAQPAPGARAVRFEHKAVDVFHWDRREQAVMAELMLRGRQTAGELRTHASRMTSLPDLPAVISILDGLKAAATPFVEELPREPGRSANRFRHLLGGGVASPDQDRAATASTIEAHGRTGDAVPVGGCASLDASADARPESDLAMRVTRLEAQVAELRAEVARLSTREPREAPAIQ